MIVTEFTQLQRPALPSLLRRVELDAGSPVASGKRRAVDETSYEPGTKHRDPVLTPTVGAYRAGDDRATSAEVREVGAFFVRGALTRARRQKTKRMALQGRGDIAVSFFRASWAFLVVAGVTQVHGEFILAVNEVLADPPEKLL